MPIMQVVASLTTIIFTTIFTTIYHEKGEK